jgi:predicted dienelactone hydrolase
VPPGCRIPVVHLANGTGASCSSYQQVLNRLASHGFLTTCYESTQTGAGTQGVQAIETAYRNHADLADTKIGSTGHSQGGQAAFTVLQQAEAKWGDSYTYAGLAMQPASGFGAQPPGGTWQSVYGRIKSPMFMFSGTADTLVAECWVQQGFDALNDAIEAYNWSAVGSTHIPTPQTHTMQVAVAWFRWKLLGDNEACKAFKALPAGAEWNMTKEQNPKNCL